MNILKGLLEYCQCGWPIVNGVGIYLLIGLIVSVCYRLYHLDRARKQGRTIKNYDSDVDGGTLLYLLFYPFLVVRYGLDIIVFLIAFTFEAIIFLPKIIAYAIDAWLFRNKKDSK